VEWPQKIETNILYNLQTYKSKILNHFVKSKIKITSAYNSLLITYASTIDNINNEILTLKSLYSEEKWTEKSSFKLWKIPVCYNDDFALDLVEISIEKEMSKQSIIELHSGAIYTVYFVGFLPGFLYLGGLDEKLYIPRKSKPRLKIEKGAVAIGGNQTGIYPNESPGGWNIIGNTPIVLFDASKETPCFAKAGDRIQFVPISLKEHHDISTLIKAGVYQMESEVIDG